MGHVTEIFRCDFTVLERAAKNLIFVRSMIPDIYFSHNNKKSNYFSPKRWLSAAERSRS